MKEIFEVYHETRSLLLRNHLVEMNIGLARKMAHRMKDNCQLEYEELFELATLGLIKAVERYNPNQKYFTSFALPYIRGEIQHYLRDKTSVVRVPRGLVEMMAKIKKTRNTLSSQLSRRPSDAEVALYLGISKSELEEAVRASQNQKYLWSLDCNLEGTDDLTLGDTLVGGNSTQCSSEVILEKLRLAIKDIKNPAIELIFIEGKSIQATQKALKLTHSQINTLLLQGMEELARLDICDLDEAVAVAAAHDLDDFSAVGSILPSESMTFLRLWLSEGLVAA